MSCCAALLTLEATGTFAADEVLGTLQRTVGDCTVRSVADAAPRPIAVGAAIRVGDRLTCNKSGKIVLSLPGDRSTAEPELVAEIAYVVPEGSPVKPMPEGTRPGLRANFELNVVPNRDQPENAGAGQRFAQSERRGSVEAITVAESAVRREGTGLRESVIVKGTFAEAPSTRVGALNGLTQGIGATRNSSALGVSSVIQVYVAVKRAEANHNEDNMIKAVVRDMREDRKKIEAFVVSANTVLREASRRVSALTADRTEQPLDAAAIASARKREEQNIEPMRRALVDTMRTRDLYAEVSSQFQLPSPVSRAMVGGELAGLNRSVSELERITAAYGSLLQGLGP